MDGNDIQPLQAEHFNGQPRKNDNRAGQCVNIGLQKSEAEVHQTFGGNRDDHRHGANGCDAKGQCYPHEIGPMSCRSGVH